MDKLPVGPDSRKEDGTPAQYFSAAVNLNNRRTAFATANAQAKARPTNVSRLPAYTLHLQKFAESLPKTVYRTVLRPENYIGKYMELASLLPDKNLSLGSDPVNPDIFHTSVVGDFRSKWEFMYIMGHGVLAPELPAVAVPPRTYVRFNAPGGCRARVVAEDRLAPIMAFPETFTASPDDFLAKMADHHFNNTGPLESFSSLAERMAVAANPYPDTYCSTPRNLGSESTKPECLVNPLQRKQTIYGPGEKIQEMKINFSNNPYQMMMLGVYNLPIPRGYADFLSSIFVNLDKDRPKELDEMTREEFAIADVAQKGYDMRFLGGPRYTLFDASGRTVVSSGPNPNLKRDWILRTFSLAQIFAGLGPVPEGKVRFLFINSCRGVPFTLGDTGLVSDILGGAPAAAAAAGAAAPVRRLNIPTRKNLAFRARRASLATETGDEDELEKLLAARRVLRRARARDGGVSAAELAAAQAIDDSYAPYIYNPLLDAKKTMIVTAALTLVPLDE